MKILLETFLLLIPLIFSGVLHMGVVTTDVLSTLKIPINEIKFGKNKTYRGFVVMPILTIPGVYLSQLAEKSFDLNIGFNEQSSIILGVLLGIFYCLFELPNSYYKRLKGIAPGKMASNDALKHAIIDQADSGFGLIIVYYIMLNVSLTHLLLFLLIGTLVHLILNFLLFKIGLRKEPL